MSITTGQIRDLLRPGLDAVFGDYDSYPEQWSEIFKTSQSTMAEEYDVEMRFLGAASIVPEGAPIPVDTMSQKVRNSYRHVLVAQSFVVTKQAVDDNQYKSQFFKEAEALKASLRDTKNQLGANILNNAFNAAYSYGDGQPACSELHPIDGGTYSNKLVANGGVTIDLGEGALEALLILSQKTRTWSGLKVSLKPEKLIVCTNDQFTASRLLDSAFRPETANNDINALHKNNYIPSGYKVNQFLTGPAFFLLTNQKNGLKHFQRQAIETDAYADFDTKAAKFSALERYSFGISDSRAIFGSPGA
jgi:hypothetical protein